MFVATSWFSGQARKAFRQVRSRVGDVNASLQENLSAVREAQAFNREDQNIETFSESNAATRDANIRAVAFTSALQPTLEALGYVAVALVAGVGGLMLLSGQSAVRHDGVARPDRRVHRLHPALQPADLADLGDVDQHAERDRRRRAHLRLAGRRAGPAGRSRTRARCRRSRAGSCSTTSGPSTSRAEPVLRDVNLTAEPGQMIAIVGPTGAGKTTIINLIPRFYDVSGGSVTIDGIDVRDVTAAQPARADRHRAAGLVPVQRHGDEQHPLRPARRRPTTR